jgi:peroxiredoxin
VVNPLTAINPHDPKVQPEDSFDKMKERAAKYQYTFPYLVDETQNVTRTYGATRTPHVFVLQKSGTQLVVKYIGAIDDNTEKPEAVETPYVERAVNALLTDSEVKISTTKAIGCTIKWRKS